MQTEAIKRAKKNMTKNGRQVVHFFSQVFQRGSRRNR